MKKVIIFFLMSVLTLSINAQSRKSGSGKRVTSSATTKKRTVTNVASLGKVWIPSKEPFDGFWNFTVNGKYINIQATSGSIGSIDEYGRELPPTNKPEITSFSVEGTDCTVECDENGRIIAKDGDTIVFDGYLYWAKRGGYRLYGKLYGKQINAKEMPFN